MPKKASNADQVANIIIHGLLTTQIGDEQLLWRKG
jgi:hypothetical protein